MNISKLVKNLEIQVTQLKDKLKKKDSKLETMANHISELKKQLRKTEKERDWLADQAVLWSDGKDRFNSCCKCMMYRTTGSVISKEHWLKAAKEAVL